MTVNRESVTGLKNGESAMVVEVRGTDRIVRKLEAMGIMPGTAIRKKSSSPLHGPVVLEKQGMLFAIGRSLAQRIIVEMPRMNPS
jgi:Fe2+ transport system protein FeoA